MVSMGVINTMKNGGEVVGSDRNYRDPISEREGGLPGVSAQLGIHGGSGSG